MHNLSETQRLQLRDLFGIEENVLPAARPVRHVRPVARLKRRATSQLAALRGAVTIELVVIIAIYLAFVGVGVAVL